MLSFMCARHINHVSERCIICLYAGVAYFDKKIFKFPKWESVKLSQTLSCTVDRLGSGARLWLRIGMVRVGVSLLWHVTGPTQSSVESKWKLRERQQAGLIPLHASSWYGDAGLTAEPCNETANRQVIRITARTVSGPLPVRDVIVSTHRNSPHTGHAQSGTTTTASGWRACSPVHSDVR